MAALRPTWVSFHERENKQAWISRLDRLRSFDARNEGQNGGWSLMIFCARATRGCGLPSLDVRSGRSVSPHPLRENKQAWREHTYRPMRAITGSLGCSSKERHRGGSAWLHGDVKTTMMYIHVLNCGSGGVRSPLDGLCSLTEVLLCG